MITHAIRKRSRSLDAVCVLCFTLFFSGHLRADPERRKTLAQSYIEQSQKNRSIFSGAPVNHIIPAFNTITYAADIEKTDVTILPEDMSTSSNYSEKLKYSGYRVSPYMALSLKYIGLGFSLEGGQKSLEYSRNLTWLSLTGKNRGLYEPQSADAANAYNSSQKSTLNYRDVGVYVYWIPVPNLLDRTATFTLIFGSRNYNCQHYVDTDNMRSVDGQSVSQSSTGKKFPYTVISYEAGANFIYRFSQQFSVIPWGQYYYADTQTIELLSESNASDEYYKILEDDVQLFWHSEPQFTYGLDFALRFRRFEIHLGGALGALSSYSAPRSEFISDKSISASISFDMKGSN